MSKQVSNIQISFSLPKLNPWPDIRATAGVIEVRQIH
jgi:hypothetical protein